MSNSISFSTLAIPSTILDALAQLGHETPTPIQQQSIPALMEGQDLLGQAQTGTGKTGAFAIPLLARLEKEHQFPQVLVLTPTRELAMQVAESFQNYAKNITGTQTLTIYGGQGYSEQLRALKKGVQVVVGTPGRVLDHLKRGSLNIGELRSFVLDEADEMLKMGFIEDVEEILSQAPHECQMAMFSATMPNSIKKIANQYLKNPSEVKIVSKTATVEKIQQNYLYLKNAQKMDALLRILEVEEHDGILIFTKTKATTLVVAENLGAKGFTVSALNGDMNQNLRERTIQNLKNKKIDIVVATDVAARGLDVERLSLVVNYDIPHDTESYIHRIGRTGRAGRQGKAILFVTPQEKKTLFNIERATKQKVEEMRIPSDRDIENKRMQRFTERIAKTLEDPTLYQMSGSLEQVKTDLHIDSHQLSLALVAMLQKHQPLKIAPPPKRKEHFISTSSMKKESFQSEKPKKKRSRKNGTKLMFDQYRLEVGKQHKVRVADIVGAIANEADIQKQYIGNIKLYDDHSIVELPKGMPKEVFHLLKKVSICKRRMNLKLVA